MCEFAAVKNKLARYVGPGSKGLQEPKFFKE